MENIHTIDGMVKEILSAMPKKKSMSVAVTGATGLGKTYLARKLADALRKDFRVQVFDEADPLPSVDVGKPMTPAQQAFVRPEFGEGVCIYAGALNEDERNYFDVVLHLTKFPKFPTRVHMTAPVGEFNLHGEC